MKHFQYIENKHFLSCYAYKYNEHFEKVKETIKHWKQKSLILYWF